MSGRSDHSVRDKGLDGGRSPGSGTVLTRKETSLKKDRDFLIE